MSGDNDVSMFDRYLAPNYPYHKNISSPEDMDMKIDGGLDTLANDFVGLINYAELLIAGTGNANKKIKNEGVNQPLGDRIFIDTPGECYPVNLKGELINPDDDSVLDDQEKKDQYKVARSVFIDHVPTGYIPGMGNIGAFRGLLPGMLGNLLELNPVSMLTSFTSPGLQPCLRTKMEEIRYRDSNPSSRKHQFQKVEKWVTENDLKSLNPCSFIDAEIGGETFNKKNPISGNTADCADGFSNIFSKKKHKPLLFSTKDKPLANLFNTTFGLLLAFILYRVLIKEMKN